jgi:hypothetical protein
MCSLARIVAVVAAATCLSGCVHVLQAYNTPGQERLHFVNASGGQYAVRIEDNPQTLVPPDGRVLVDVPRLPRGCSVYLFGVIKLSDGSPERVRAIQVLRNGKVVRRLSLQTIHNLPLDSDDYRMVKL